MPFIEPTLSERGWRRMLRSWNAFWFTPRDPTVLGLIRICCGAITSYTLFTYTFVLGDFVGPSAWIDQQAIEAIIYERPVRIDPLSGAENPPVAPSTPEEQLYGEGYQKEFHEWPPPPYPRNRKQAEYCATFRRTYQFDLRAYGLPPPETEKQWNDVVVYAEKYKHPMPPPYPKDDAEVARIDDFVQRFGGDPRRAYAFGTPTFSVWYHVHDPFWMGVIHAFFIGVAVLFTLGIGTRVTSLLTWFAYLNYIHRNWVQLFGVDTMITILLLYLMIGASGGAYSLDRLIARWWRGRKSGGGLAPPEPLVPTVSANVAIRLLQIHLCIIYLMAGLSKLLGPAWWNGTALWNVLANYEFAPMNWDLYNMFLRQLGRNQFVFEFVLTGGAYFTLAFEILYAFWIWRPGTRRIMLAAAALLHGVIGVFMGLGTFALIMLVMNMAFLRTEEANWILASLGFDVGPDNKVAGAVPMAAAG